MKRALAVLALLLPLLALPAGASAQTTSGVSIQNFWPSVAIVAGRTNNPTFTVVTTRPEVSGFSTYGYPTTFGPGINWTVGSAGMVPGRSVEVGIQVNSDVPPGIYTGNGELLIYPSQERISLGQITVTVFPPSPFDVSTHIIYGPPNMFVKLTCDAPGTTALTMTTSGGPYNVPAIAGIWTTITDLIADETVLFTAQSGNSWGSGTTSHPIHSLREPYNTLQVTGDGRLYRWSSYQGAYTQGIPELGEQLGAVYFGIDCRG